MKTLYLLRHAKAEPGGSTIADEDRPLSTRGREACKRIGQYMKTKKYDPQLVICSNAVRTRETAELVAAAQGGTFNGKLVAAAQGGTFNGKLEKKLYLATAGEMLTMVHKTDDAVASLMLIGHNPGMHHLAALLANADHTVLRMELEMKYPTGALTVIAFDTERWGSIMPDSGALRDFVAPDGL